MHEHFVGIVKPRSKEAEMLAAIDFARLPQHVAVIMDGNGRWAKKRGKPRIFGHREGSQSVKAIIDTFARLQIKAITLYAFSTENWKRPRYEVDALMRMLRKYLRIELDEIQRQNIRFQTIGRTEVLTPRVREEIARASEQTASNTGMILSVALNYGGRTEIVDAARAAMRKLEAAGKSFDELDEGAIAQELYTSNLPELDLLVRTSGEMRISNFLLWQSAYAEIYVTDTLWPDFRRPHLLQAVADYQQRSRRFGGLKLVTKPRAVASG